VLWSELHLHSFSWRFYPNVSEVTHLWSN